MRLFYKVFSGADNAIRTRDLILTKDVLCRLSYISKYRLPSLCRYWQGQKDLNPRHVVLETTALPAELYPYTYHFIAILQGYSLIDGHKKRWWAIRDSNPRPTGYEPVALTN